MGRNKKFRPGDPVGSLPTQTWNRMAGEVDELTLALATEEDLRKPKVKSPVHAQIVWCSDTDCEPGNVVNIRGAASDLSEDDGAPFAGLLLLATEFIEGEASDAYAITMGPIDGGESWDATLTTRTNDSEGVLTMPDGSHGIVEESQFILIWEDGSRVGVVAGNVNDDSVPFEGGYGDDLPDADTEIRVTRQASTVFAVLPEAYWAKVDFSAADQTTAGIPSSGTVLSGGGSIKVIWREPGTGEKWAVIQLAGAGSGGTSSLRFGRVEDGETITAATGWGDDELGTGPVELKTGDGVFGETVSVKNEFFDSIAELVPVYVEQRSDGEWYIVRPGCNPGPSEEE